MACANASQYGNNAYIAPAATLTDGMLDITVLEPFTMIEVPALAYQLFNKRLDQNSHFKTFRCKKLTIKREKPGVMHYDGDPVEGGKDIEVEIIHKGLNVIIPIDREVRDAANPVFQLAQDYIRDIKEMNETIADNIHERNQKIIQKITKRL